MRRLVAGWLTAALLWAGGASADPQANVGLRMGPSWSEQVGTRLFVGLHGDVLYGRSGPRSWGFGPCAEGWTDWAGWGAAAGVSALVPVHELLPAVVSVKGGWRGAEDWSEPTVGGELFLGSRSYNYHGVYGMAGGLVVETRKGLGDTGESALVLSVHLDGEVLALPIIFVIGAMQGD